MRASRNDSQADVCTTPRRLHAALLQNDPPRRCKDDVRVVSGRCPRTRPVSGARTPGRHGIPAIILIKSAYCSRVGAWHGSCNYRSNMKIAELKRISEAASVRGTEK